MDSRITATYRGPRPLVATSGELGRRKHQLTRDPSMHQLAHGLWCRADSPPDHVQRAMLLQRHLNCSGSSVRITGITALQVLGIPIGSHYRWADRALCHPAPMMSRWALTAALDALLVHRDLRPVDSTPAWTSQSCGEPLTPPDIYSALETLPPTSRAVMAVRTALKSTQFPTLSPMETLTRLMLLACGLPCPEKASISRDRCRSGAHVLCSGIAAGPNEGGREGSGMGE